MDSNQNGITGRLKRMFNGRSTISRQNSPPLVVSPKSPAPRLGLSILSSPTIDLPGIPSHVLPSSRASISPRSIHRITPQDAIAIAAPSSARSGQSRSAAHSVLPNPSRSEVTSPRTNWDWEHVRDHSGSIRRRRRKRAIEQVRPRHGVKSILQEKAGRSKLIRCFGLGLLLAVGLTIYLALALSNVINGLNVHIFMIVVGLVLVMAFAHATVRLCMYILRPPQYPISRTNSNATIAPGEPIPVVLRRDEEDFSEDETEGIPKDAVLPAPPPAYGLWRGSTRMNPNLMHWRRVETLQREAASPESNNRNSEQTSSPNRPPSYATEDGVRYIVDAELRSAVPEAGSGALPVHPSERGRIASGVL